MYQINDLVPTPVAQIKRIAQELAKTGNGSGKQKIVVVMAVAWGDGCLDALTFRGTRLLIAQRDKSNLARGDGVLPFAVAERRSPPHWRADWRDLIQRGDLMTGANLSGIDVVIVEILPP